MVSALDSRASSLGLSPGRGQCVVFLHKTLYSHGASLHKGVHMGTCEYNAGAYPCFSSMKRLGVFLFPPGWDASPLQGYPQH